MDKRWVKLHKQFLQWEWFDKPEMVQLFIYLLLKANFAEAEWHGTRLKRGQLITSASSIERDLRLSPRTIRTCLNRLKSTKEVAIETTNRFSIITILKYEDYQLEQNEEDKQNGKQSDERPTNDRQASDKQATTDIEEEKKRRIEEKNNIVDDITRARFFDEFFSEERKGILEALCMNNRTDLTTMKRLAKEVLDEWEATGRLKHKDLSDARNHLLNQIRIKLTAECNNSTATQRYGTTQNTKQHIDANQAEIAQLVASKLAGTYSEPDISGDY